MISELHGVVSEMVSWRPCGGGSGPASWEFAKGLEDAANTYSLASSEGLRFPLLTKIYLMVLICYGVRFVKSL